MEAGQRTLIRLAEIDSPDSDQPYGVEAQRVVCAIICGKYVEIDPRGTSYDRVVGLILAPYDVSEAMVKAGAAWEYS